MSRLDDLTAEVMALPLDARLELAERIWASIPQPPGMVRDDAELMRICEERYQAVKDGRDPGIPAREALAAIRKELGCE